LYARKPNPGHSAFAEFLSNTVNNTCLAVLAAANSGHRQLDPCALQALKQECGGEEYRTPSAKSFRLRTWAVAYGRSGFELSLVKNPIAGSSDARRALANTLEISGPLLYASTHPVWQTALHHIGGPGTIGSVYLWNNDGAGNLNLQINFNGQPESSMRVSVTSMLPDTAPVGPVPATNVK
jgi:hypothetical protein